MVSERLDKQYSDLMKNHPFGIALYHPLLRSTFNPGACGYFDDFGTWNPIVHLESDIAALNKKGLKTTEDELEKAPIEDGIKWGPKTSSNVRARKIQLSGGVDPAPGIPVSASVVYSYSIDSDVGAILLTTAPVRHEYYYHTSPFKGWCKNNALAILRKYPEVKQHGLWIVTSIYTTKKCAINMWKRTGRGLKVEFSADVAGFGSLGPGGEWYCSKTDEGWGEYTSQGDDSTVVFFGGLKFQYSWVMGKNLKYDTGKPTFRGEKVNKSKTEFIATVDDPDHEGASYELDCETILAEDDLKVPVQVDEDW